jgi:hypothetical protein
MIDHAPRRLAPVALAIVAAWLVAVGSAVPAQAQTHQAAAAGAPSADVPFGFKAYGVFSRMITQRTYLAIVALKEATDGRATDAIGAVSGLRGEISMIEGRLIVSYGVDCGASCPATTSETATLLATASAQNWRAVAIDKDLDAKATETFIRAQAKANGLDENKPFPFCINGAITDFVMHVNAAPNPRFKGHGSFDEMAVTGLTKGPRLAGSVVGFYAPPAFAGRHHAWGRLLPLALRRRATHHDGAYRQLWRRGRVDFAAAQARIKPRSAALVHTAAARRRSGGTASSASAASAASSGITSCFSWPRRRIDTRRSAASFLPTTSSAGTLASECSRTL